MKQSIVRVVLLAVVLVVVFGVYRLLTVAPVDQTPFVQGTQLLVLAGPAGSTGDGYTRADFNALHDTGVAGFHVPVVLTRDGELVIAPPQIAASVASLSLAEATGQGMVGLEELYAVFPDYRLAVELQQPTLQSVAALLNSVDAIGARDRTLVIIDDQQLADVLRSQAPDLATAATSAETAAFLTTANLHLTPFYRPTANVVLAPAEHFTAHQAAAAHSRGMALLVIASAGEADPSRWLQQGADGVILDSPGP